MNLRREAEVADSPWLVSRISHHVRITSVDTKAKKFQRSCQFVTTLFLAHGLVVHIYMLKAGEYRPVLSSLREPYGCRPENEIHGTRGESGHTRPAAGDDRNPIPFPKWCRVTYGRLA